MSFYQTLGVSETATQDEIKQAFRKLASKHHPDKGGDTSKFQEIQQAYDILSDPEKRQQYDLELQGLSRGGMRFQWNSQEGSIHDLFRGFGFGEDNPFERMRQPRRNKDIRIKIDLSLEETLQSVGKTIQIQTTNGHKETLNINIPRGIEHGSTIKYTGLGDNFFETLPRGDLYIVISLLPHDRFRLVNSDLVTDLRIDAIDAMIGTQREITGIDGRTFLLTIPAGCQPGTRLRIKDQGLYSTNSLHRGNIIVEVVVEVQPIKDPAQRQILEGLKLSK
jgi:curved DNA-binding protein